MIPTTQTLSSTLADARNLVQREKREVICLFAEDDTAPSSRDRWHHTLGDDDVPFDTLRTLRFGARQLAGGDAIGPVTEQLSAERSQREQLLRHLLA